MFKKGDKVVCIDSADSANLLEKGRTYKVEYVSDGLVYINDTQGFYPRRFKLLAPEQPIWNNKRPKDMSKEELKAFICDRIDEVAMELALTNGEWRVSDRKFPFNYKPGSRYRIKPPKSAELCAAEKALAEAQEAVKAAQKAVAELSK